ncbi:hypothetical protein Tco_1211014 [Tanacetum coccineum]
MICLLFDKTQVPELPKPIDEVLVLLGEQHQGIQIRSGNSLASRGRPDKSSGIPYDSIESIVEITKVIKGEFEKLESVKISDVSLTCNTSLEISNDEFNRTSRMEDDLFTNEVEIVEVTNIPCDLKKEDDLEQQMSHESDNDMEYDPSDVEFTEWAFKEFNYLLQIDPDILTKDIDGFKTYMSHPAKAETRCVTRKDIITTQWRLYREFYMK